MAYTYSQGNTVEKFLGGEHANADVTRLLTADEYGNQFNPLYGMSPFDYLRSMNVDPTNMNAPVPDPMDRPDVSGNLMVALAMAAAGGAGLAGVGGAAGATGAGGLDAAISGATVAGANTLGASAAGAAFPGLTPVTAGLGAAGSTAGVGSLFGPAAAGALGVGESVSGNYAVQPGELGGNSIFDQVKNLFTSTPPGSSTAAQQLLNTGESVSGNYAASQGELARAAASFGGGAGGLLGMPWGTVASLGSLATGLFGLGKAGDISGAANRAAAAQDPFGPYRGQFASDLMALMADPSLIEKRPGYKAGLRAQQRALAAQGFNPGKGGTPGQWTYAMDKFGGDQYAAEFNRLAQGAGMNIPPSGGNLMLQGAVNSTMLQGQALQSIIAGIRGLATGS